MLQEKLIATAALLVIVLSASTVAVPAKPVKVGGTKVSMEQPSGFTPAGNFSGFQSPEQRASIMVTEIPGPFGKVSAGFNEQGLATKGIQLLSRKEMKVSNENGLLIEASQAAAGGLFRKWILTFGDDSHTVVVTAAFPTELAKQLSQKLRDSVLSTTYDAAAATPSPTDNLPFRVSGNKKLKLAGRIQNSLVFTPNGQMVGPNATGDATVFVVGQALSDLEINDRADFARNRLRQSAGLSDFTILKESAVAISGLPGREILATAVGRRGEQVFVYQTMVFGLGSYFIMQGITDKSARASYEPEFKAISDSFKLR